ncbi:hypothetical protein [Citromicrobium sp. WPS32]|uniref:hypothetical protein n=1 Tax=Citromicrobium sp. WPS32 TaxID=1634517 RepID=UPI000B10DA7E|nr:hypothetical protein [Citromicrobium sp. WPS32]|tara:strand:- start:353 stop:1222 length:870 start_codon:yes stop_codon:yes gene_type:complete
MGWSVGSKDTEAQRHQTEYADRTDSRIGACFGNAVPERECVEKAIRDNHEQQRAEADLNAQRQMADWAFWVLVVAGASFIVTSIGTIFLAWQVYLTREAVKDTGEGTEAMVEANRIAANAQRPWIAIDAELLHFSCDDRILQIECNVTFRNTGKMVAENFDAYVTHYAVATDFLEAQEATFDKFTQRTNANDMVIVPGQDTSWAFQSNLSTMTLPWRQEGGCRKDMHFLVLAMARYRLPGEKRWRFAMKSFGVGEYRSNVDDRHIIHESVCEQSAETMRIRPFGRSRAT